MTEKDKLLQETLSVYEKNNYNGVVLLPTGSGKGRIMIEIAKKLNVKSILYLCNTVLLRDKMFVDELHKWDAAYLIDRIELACYQTAYKWKDKHYDLVLADEFDAALTPAYMQVFTNNTFTYKVLVSATLDGPKMRLAAKIAPIILKHTLTDLINNKVLNSIKYSFVNFNLTAIENIEYLGYNMEFKNLLNEEPSVRRDYKLGKLQIERKQFMCRLQSSVIVTKWLTSFLRKRNEKILIFCGLSSEADNVSKYSYHSGSKINYLEQFNCGAIKELAVVDKIDRGVNIVDVRHIIHKSISRGKTKMVQRTGRGMRLNVDETLYVYFLVPYYHTRMGALAPTIVKEWVIQSTEDMNLTDSKTIYYEQLK